MPGHSGRIESSPECCKWRSTLSLKQLLVEYLNDTCETRIYHIQYHGILSSECMNEDRNAYLVEVFLNIWKGPPPFIAGSRLKRFLHVRMASNNLLLSIIRYEMRCESHKISPNWSRCIGNTASGYSPVILDIWKLVPLPQYFHIETLCYCNPQRPLPSIWYTHSFPLHHSLRVWGLISLIYESLYWRRWTVS